MPHSSAQRTWKSPTVVGVAYATLFTPGLASAFTPSVYAQKEWMTSSEVTLNCTGWLTGSASCVVSKPPNCG